MTYDPNQHGGRSQEKVEANYRIAAYSFLGLALTLFWGFVAWVIAGW